MYIEEYRYLTGEGDRGEIARREAGSNANAVERDGTQLPEQRTNSRSLVSGEEHSGINVLPQATAGMGQRKRGASGETERNTVIADGQWKLSCDNV